MPALRPAFQHRRKDYDDRRVIQKSRNKSYERQGAELRALDGCLLFGEYVANKLLQESGSPHSFTDQKE